MIGAGEISKRAGAANVDARTVERDYMLAHIAADISDVAGPSLVLKGGTSLRLGHFVGYRFSADLDYSAVGLDASQARNLVTAALIRTKDRVGLSHLELVEKAGDDLAIEYVGPLGANPRLVKVDIALDEPVLEPERHLLIVGWRDLDRSRGLHVYSLREVCAEKLRCVIQRRQCRDAFDLWSLTERERKVDLIDAWPSFEVKAKHKQIVPAQFFDAWSQREPLYRQGWAKELGAYVGQDIPEIDAVMRQMNRQINNLREVVAIPKGRGRNSPK